MNSTTSEPQSGDEGNPYASPAAAPNRTPLTLGERIGSVLSASPEKYEAVGRAMVMWELLRIPYNVLMLLAAIVGVALAQPANAAFISSDFADWLDWLLVANLCFLLGHVVDGYLAWIGLRGRWSTGALFLGGSLFAVVMTFLATRDIFFSSLYFEFLGIRITIENVL